jgi:hypothetical protein
VHANLLKYGAIAGSFKTIFLTVHNSFLDTVPTQMDGNISANQSFPCFNLLSKAASIKRNISLNETQTENSAYAKISIHYKYGT